MKSTRPISQKKTLLSAAIGVAIGLANVQVSHSDPIIGWDLGDVIVGEEGPAGTDGLISDFAFSSVPSGSSTSAFGPIGETGCVNALDGNTCDPIDMQTGGGGIPPLVFTTGFNFGGTGDFFPNVTNNIAGDITIDEAGDRSVNFGALDFGGLFPGTSGTQFFLSPDSLTNCTGLAGCGTVAGSTASNAGYLANVVPLGGTNFGILARYVGTISDPSSPFNGFQSNWRLEGIMAVADQAPTLFLNGVDPTLATPDQPYTDDGAVCADVVDGLLSVTSTLTLDPTGGIPASADSCDLLDAGPAGAQHLCTYTCTDSQLQNATPVTRTINVGEDTTPPVVTLLAAPPVEGDGRSDAPDGTSVDILVGVTYVDAGATCIDDLDGDIPLGDARFTVDPDPPVVDTSAPTPVGTPATISFSCTDTAGNGPAVEVRTVNVIADEDAPVITLGGSAEINIPVGANFTVNEPPSTCTDTNPVDALPIDITQNLMFSPPEVDTSVPGTTVITYTCEDDAGNPAVPVTQTVNVVGGAGAENFQIISMTISDLDGDGLAGCFKFNSLDSATCSLANQFSSDGSVTGALTGPNATIPGMGTDLEDGEPIGIRFGVFQPVKLISPGFFFTGFPFEPFTFDPPSEAATPPEGSIVVSGTVANLVLESFPFSGLYSSDKPNAFFLDPDPGTLATQITADNNDDDGQTRTFNYFATWSHVITGAEDPTGQFVNFNAFWRLEGVVKVNSTAQTVNNPPTISSVAASQASLANTRIVVEDDGNVTVTAEATDPDGNPISFDWSRSDSRLVPADGSTTNSTFVFNPAGLVPGVYAVRVTVTETGTQPTLSSSAELLLNLVSAAPVLGPDDSDFDGIPDDVEGYGDTDNDGLPNYHDAINGVITPNHNRRNFRDPGVGELVSDIGTLVLGTTSFSAGLDQFQVSQEHVAQFGGPGGTPVGNASDRLTEVIGIGPSGQEMLDFTVKDVDIGATVCVVLPQSEPLPTQPTYRKYSVGKGWANFVAAGGDTLGSAKRVDNVCPDPTSPAYDPLPEAQQPVGYVGLLAGDECVRVCITDGGANDGDTARNGSVSDPGTPSSDGAVPQFTTSDSGNFVSGSCTLVAEPPVPPSQRADWWLVAGFLAALGALNYRRRRKLH